jgi:hypothetical protein
MVRAAGDWANIRLFAGLRGGQYVTPVMGAVTIPVRPIGTVAGTEGPGSTGRREQYMMIQVGGPASK